MRYLVPQFLETEQKIWGPFSFKNFVVIIGVGGVVFMLYFYLNFFIWIVVAVFLAIATLALMFYRYEGLSLPMAIFSSVGNLLWARRYIWEGFSQTKNPADILLSPKIPTASDAQKAAQEDREQKKKEGLALKKMERLSKILDNE